MTTTQELLKSSFELNLNNYGPEDVERLNDWAIEAYAALGALQAEIERLTIDRRVLQADGNHPAPCAKFCEATAFTIELRRAQAEIKVQTRAADHWMAEAKLAQPPAPSDTAREYMTGYSDAKEWAQPSQAVELVAENERLRVALRFYANGEHYCLDEEEEFDTVSGEPANWLHSGVEDSATSIEDGAVARLTLRGEVITWIDGDEDGTPTRIDGEPDVAAINAKERAAHGIKQGGQHD